MLAGLFLSLVSSSWTLPVAELWVIPSPFILPCFKYFIAVAVTFCTLHFALWREIEALDERMTSNSDHYFYTLELQVPKTHGVPCASGRIWSAKRPFSSGHKVVRSAIACRWFTFVCSHTAQTLAESRRGTKIQQILEGHNIGQETTISWPCFSHCSSPLVPQQTSCPM